MSRFLPATVVGSHAGQPERRESAPLRVIGFCPQFRPRVGGAEQQSEILSDALRAEGVFTQVVTPRLEPDWPAEETIRGGVPVLRFPFLRFPRLPGVARGPGVIATVWNGLVLRRLIRSLASRFDLLHAHNASNPMVALAVREARRAGLRTAVSAVNTGYWFDLEVLRRGSPTWGRLSVRWLLRYVDLWLAKSSAIAADLRAAGIDEERIAALPNGVLIPERRRELPDLARRFLYLGRLATTAPRDVEGLIEAFERAALPEAELALVGSGDRLDEIRGRVRSSPVRERIHVPGHQDPEPWLSWAHCLVLPSFFEGLSNALLESMATGLACVAYDIAPNREALADGAAGVLVAKGDRGALRDALREIATRPGLARALGRRARERAETTYDIAQVSRRAAELYRSLLSPPTKSATARG